MLKYLAALANPAAFMHVFQFYRQLMTNYFMRTLKLQSRTELKHKRKWMLNYTHKNKSYCMLLDIKNGPPKHFVNQCMTENGTDLTAEFCEWCGPNFDFHKNESITAGMFCLMNDHTVSRLHITIDEKTAIVESEESLYEVFINL